MTWAEFSRQITEAERYDAEERAAIYEYDADMSRVDAERAVMDDYVRNEALALAVQHQRAWWES